jgi:peptidylamidoglycolate lyase
MSERNDGVRYSRRDFLRDAGMTVAGVSVAAVAEVQAQGKEPVKIGSGYFTYELVEGWGVLPPDVKFGQGCGVVVDSKDNVYVHSRSKNSVIIFDKKGKYLSNWGADFAETAHGIYWSKEGKNEFLYLTDHPRGLVVKTTLDGKELLRIGNVTTESDTSIMHTFVQPTDVAVAPTGDIYVCEGYGSQKLHRFTAKGKHLTTMGGPGNGPEQFNTCHGIWIDTRNPKRDFEVYVADRANSRVCVMTPELKIKRQVYGDVRNPCCFYQHKEFLYIPDLDHRVTILGKDDKAVAQLGDGRGKKEGDQTGFAAPHGMCVDSRGDLYVIEWVPYARLRKFKHTPKRA